MSDLTPEQQEQIRNNLHLYVDHEEIGLLLNALDRLTAQLALERTASTRTIEHLVTRKDVLEEQYQILSEQSRITLEVAAKRQEALETQVHELEQELTDLRQVGREERSVLSVEILIRRAETQMLRECLTKGDAS